MSALTIANYTFTTTAGATFGPLDSMLAQMGTLSKTSGCGVGPCPNWAATLAAYNGIQPTAGISIASLVDNTTCGDYAATTTSYWNSDTYADTFVRNAILGTGPVAGWNNESRRELLTKGAAYLVVRQSIFDRLRKGVDKCNEGARNAAVYDWEVAYALHSGNSEGVEGRGSGSSTYTLADKRCPQFATCVTGTFPARANLLALEAWRRGVTALNAGQCMSALREMKLIKAQLTVPLVQGALREAHETDFGPAGGAHAADGIVEVAEGWAFLAAFLPELALCDAGVAQLVSTNMALSLTGANGAWMSSGFKAVKEAMESQYACLGITCSDVGGMLDDNGRVHLGFEPCSDAHKLIDRGELTPPSTNLKIADYTFTSSAGAVYGFLDSKLAAMGTASRTSGCGVGPCPNWAATLAAYDSIEVISHRSVSSLLSDVERHHAYAEITAAYWGSTNHADTFVRNAILGTGPVAGWNNESRRELLTKGAAYLVVRQSIFDRLRKGVDKCNEGARNAAVYDWEVAYALHSGNSEGVEGRGSGSSTYTLADKRCPQFATCVTGTFPARANLLALEAWRRGVTALNAGQCMSALREMKLIKAQLTVPLVQGALREAHETDFGPAGGAHAADGIVEVAEGWAFLAAFLPELALCDAGVAQLVSTNMALSLTGANGAWMSSGFKAVKEAMESQYACLGITCSDVGAMLTSTGQPIADWQACSDEPVLYGLEVSRIVTYAVGLIAAVIVLAVILAILACALCYMCATKGKNARPGRQGEENYIDVQMK